MADFPAKRRKTSPTTDISVDATSTTSPEVNRSPRPSISYRQSFQSPTRSSLARSNPEVLSRVLNRSPTRSPQRPLSGRGSDRERGFGLRDKKAIRPSLTGFESTSGGVPSVSNNFPALSPRRGSGSIQAFAVPPRRMSRTVERPAVEEQEQEEEGNAAREQPQNTSVSTPTRITDPDEQLASELDSATRELEKSGLLGPSPSLDNYVEPELPPTPTQLGLEERPERRRRVDPLSSPSAGRGQQREPLGPSGLGAFDPNLPEPVQDDSQVSAAAKKKQAVKDELSAQLNDLKADVAQLEKWALQAKQGIGGPQPDQEAVTKLISLLGSTTTPHDPLSRLLAPETPPFSALISSLLPFSTKTMPMKTDTKSPEPKNSFALPKIDDSKRYLTIFAPLDLSYSTKISVLSDSVSPITEIHEIVISAQAPFPQYLFTVPLTFTTDLQSERIVSISLQKNTSMQSNIPPGLQAWIESRMTSQLLKLDISGLCFGIGQFWEASVCRARLWSMLRKRSEMLAKGRVIVDSTNEQQLLSTESMKKSALRSLIPHLKRSSMIFSYGSKKKQDSKLLLSCPLTLDHWTGEAQLKPDISISAPGLARSKSNKAERDIKQLFHNLLSAGRMPGYSEDGDRQIEAIVKATEGVISVFFGLGAPDVSS